MTITFIKFMSEGKSKLESHSWKLEKTLIYVTLSCQDTTKVLGLGGWPGHIVFWQGTLISYELGEIIEVDPKVSLPLSTVTMNVFCSRVKCKNLRENPGTLISTVIPLNRNLPSAQVPFLGSHSQSYFGIVDGTSGHCVTSPFNRLITSFRSTYTVSYKNTNKKFDHRTSMRSTVFLRYL